MECLHFQECDSIASTYSARIRNMRLIQEGNIWTSAEILLPNIATLHHPPLPWALATNSIRIYSVPCGLCPSILQSYLAT